MRNLLKPPHENITRDLNAAMEAILAATPLSAVHAKELPFAVRDLSRMLTQDRSQLSVSYWTTKRLLTAYCRYFLPWNLLRLAWLLPGLQLHLATGDTVLDLGSGPLTMPIALWIAKPEWRDIPLTFVCTDVAPGPLNLGRDILQRLAPDSCWTISLVRGPLEKILRETTRQPALITAGNVLNEIKPSRDIPLAQRLESLLRRIAGRLTPEGRFLAVEPGTRLGGKLMALTRQTAFASRLVPEAPCTHWGSCPMLADRATSWCHFTHTANAAPKELVALTRRAGLEKDGLSVSCMLLRRASPEEAAQAAALLPEVAEDNFDDIFSDEWANSGDEAEDWAEAFAAKDPSASAPQPFIRILSDPIRLPGIAEPARYACSGRGLVLARNALRMPSGAAVAVRWASVPQRDPKTNALVVMLHSPEGKPATPVTPPDPQGTAPRPMRQTARRTEEKTHSRPNPRDSGPENKDPETGKKQTGMGKKQTGMGKKQAGTGKKQTSPKARHTPHAPKNASPKEASAPKEAAAPASGTIPRQRVPRARKKGDPHGR